MEINVIANSIKEYLNDFDENKMRNLMTKHYELLHLIDEDGKWATVELEKISNRLLPNNLTEEKSKAFVDDIAIAAKKNHYLMNFLEEIEKEKAKYLLGKIKTEGDYVIPDVIALSFIFEFLTKEMYVNWKLLESCVKIFNNVKKNPKLFKYRNLFHRVKQETIEIPIKSILKFQKTGQVDADFGRVSTALNILEAAIDDCYFGYWDNARVGWTLAMNRAGSKKYNPKTGAGPSGWSANKKVVCRSMPLPKEWTDLYQTWNMAFVSKFQDFPYIIPKLLIPQVANYEEKPTEYMYNRVLALYICLNYTAFSYVEKLKTKEAIIEWNDKELTRYWGKLNRESNEKYKDELVKRR